MAHLTLRTLLAYIDDTLEPAMARQLGAKVAESELAQELIEKIKRVTRRRGLKAPKTSDDDDGISDPNTVAEYLSNSLDSEQVTRLEETCLQSDSHLAEVAACHQILTLILTEPVRVPPQSRLRMYKLVQPPLSDPNRHTRKSHHISTVVPESREGDPDDADTTFLLGLGRYSTASMIKRVAAIVAIFLLGGFLAVAVMMALPGLSPMPPETDRNYAANPPAPTPLPPAPAVPTPPVEPEPTPPTKAKDMEPPVAPIPKKGNEDLVKKIAAPKPDRQPIGKVETLNAIVLSRTADGPNWLRLDPADDSVVNSADPILCLPGFKADVQLETGVKVHLWGNVPELLPARLLETRVRFSVPERKMEGKGEDFDADLTVLAGRVYISTTKASGGRMRVRFAGQVWDVSLPDSKSEVMFEVSTSFDPGAPFSREGGVLPRVEAQAAVVRGAAGFTMPDRFKAFPKVATPSVISWDNKSGTLADPKPIEAGNGYFDRFLLVGSDQGKAVQKALSEMAGRIKSSNGIRLMLAEILTEAPDPTRIVAAQMAVYGQASIAYGVGAADELKPLIDLLNDEMKGYARFATVNALVSWIAQAPENTALLGTVITAKLRSEQDTDTILRLLRGAVSPSKPDPRDLDRLVDYLSHGSIAIRELALWNLVNYVDPIAAKTPALITDVAQAGTPMYEKFVKAWRTRIEEIKMKLSEKK